MSDNLMVSHCCYHPYKTRKLKTPWKTYVIYFCQGCGHICRPVKYDPNEVIKLGHSMWVGGWEGPFTLDKEENTDE